MAESNLRRVPVAPQLTAGKTGRGRVFLWDADLWKGSLARRKPAFGRTEASRALSRGQSGRRGRSFAPLSCPSLPRVNICFLIHPPGIPNLITADMIKEGAAVIDVGINRVQDPVTAKPKLVGDVDFEGMGGGTERALGTP